MSQSLEPSPEKLVAFVDLDDTLFYTKGKCRQGDHLTAAAVDRNGQPLSFMGSAQRILWRLLSQAVVIPVTGRNLDAYSRVLLKFEYGAIVSYGGVILDPNGQIDKRWQKIIRPEALRLEDYLSAILAKARGLIEQERLQAKARIIGDLDLAFYVVIKTQPDSLRELKFLQNELKKTFPQANVHLNGNNLAILPQYLDKAGAVNYFLQTYFPPQGERLCLTVGDSLSDLGFLALGDYIMTPSQGQLGLKLLRGLS